jgi:hypothetical protein
MEGCIGPAHFTRPQVFGAYLSALRRGGRSAWLLGVGSKPRLVISIPSEVVRNLRWCAGPRLARSWRSLPRPPRSPARSDCSHDSEGHVTGGLARPDAFSPWRAAAAAAGS